MPLPRIALPASVIAFAALFASPMTIAAEAGEIEPLESVRSQDQVVVSVGLNLVTFNETIVVAPIKRKPDNERPDPVHLVNVLLTPLWIKEGETMRPAFPTLRPTLNISQGRVRRIALVRPDGDFISSVNDMTPECRYALTVEFGHVVPANFTVNVFQSSSTGIPVTSELSFLTSNDGQRQRSGPPESFFTSFRVRAEGPLDPWVAFQGEERLERVDAYSVRLEREKTYRVRFGVK